MPAPTSPLPHVVIVGGGFGGLTLAQSLAEAPLRITLVDRSNHHLFQPLLYQVAMAGLSPAEIAAPIRSILSGQRNVEVVLDRVRACDLPGRRVFLHDGRALAYDYLVLAVGACTSWFGQDQWAAHALPLKDLEDALAIRHRVLAAFEAAERAPLEPARRRLLSFVVIGGGPTGVELAGALAELARWVLARDFRRIDPARARVVLVEAGPRILPSFSPELSRRAVEQLGELGVEVKLGRPVTRIDRAGVQLGDEIIESASVIWAAGVRGHPLLSSLSAPLDRQGRVLVEPDCSLPGRPEVFVIGDAAAFTHGLERALPGVSPVAMQQARHLAANLQRRTRGLAGLPFRYLDKGSMATIGRSRAITQMGKLELSGPLAWAAWLFVHIWYLIGFKNRFFVLLTWAWSYFTYKRGARLITARDSAALLERHVEPGEEGLRRPAEPR